jgi:hypothetical protein
VIVDQRAVSAGKRRADTMGASTDSAPTVGGHPDLALAQSP